MLDLGDGRGRGVRWRPSSMLMTALLCAASSAPSRADAAAGARARAARAEVLEGQLTRPGRIEEAIARHRAEPAALVARWKLLRALVEDMQIRRRARERLAALDGTTS